MELTPEDKERIEQEAFKRVENDVSIDYSMEAMVSAEKRGYDKATQALTEQVEKLKAENMEVIQYYNRKLLEVEDRKIIELSRLREEQKELVEALREATAIVKEYTYNMEQESWPMPNRTAIEFRHKIEKIESLLSKFEVPNV